VVEGEVLVLEEELLGLELDREELPEVVLLGLL